MTYIDRIQTDLKTAMKAGDKAQVSTLRMLLSSLKYAAIDAELDDALAVKVLTTEAKKRREAIEAYKDVSPERADQETAELAIIQTYLPQQMSDQALETTVSQVVSSVPDSSNFGAVMGAVMKQLKADGAVVDGNRVRQAVEAALK